MEAEIEWLKTKRNKTMQDHVNERRIVWEQCEDQWKVY